MTRDEMIDRLISMIAQDINFWVLNGRDSDLYEFLRQVLGYETVSLDVLKDELYNRYEGLYTEDELIEMGLISNN